MLVDASVFVAGLVVASLSAALSALIVLYVVRPSSAHAPSAPRPSSPSLQEVTTSPTPSYPAPAPDAHPHARLGVPSSTPISTPLVFVAETKLPTSHGVLHVRAYRSSTGAEPLAIVAGGVRGRRSVPVRVHDACLTSEALGSLKCDCAQQLQLALDKIAEEGCGVVVYLPQEGRGIGLANKIAVYSQQEKGFDTVEANTSLGFPSEARTYEAAAFMLADLGIESIALLSNNPHKFTSLKALGVAIEARVPVLVAPNTHSQRYLQVKRSKMGHDLTHLHTHPHTHDHDHHDRDHDRHTELAAVRTLVELRA